MDPLSFIAILISGLSIITGGGVYAHRHIRGELGPKALGSNQERKKDKYGFWAELEWVIVAGFEHELGFTHTSESEPHCGRKECWSEDQRPTYELVNGFLSITSFPELPEEVKELDAFGRRLKNVFDQPLSAAAPIEQLNARLREKEAHFGTQGMQWGLKHELNKRKELHAQGKYVPPVMTPNEARALGFFGPDHDILEAKQKEHYRQEAAKRKKELELKFKGDDQWHSDEYRELEAMLKKYLSDDGTTMVLPAGYTVTWKRGGELAYIQSPTGLSVWVDPELYRVKPTLTATDRRRDELPDVSPELTHTKPGAWKPEDVLFSAALKAMNDYSTPGRYED